MSADEPFASRKDETWTHTMTLVSHMFRLLTTWGSAWFREREFFGPTCPHAMNEKTEDFDGLRASNRSNINSASGRIRSKTGVVGGTVRAYGFPAIPKVGSVKLYPEPSADLAA